MDFIREQIKEKPINKKRIVKQVGIAVLCGVAFALAAVLVLLLFMPIIKDVLGQDVGAVIPGTESENQSSAMEEDSGAEESTEDDIVIPDVSLSIEDYQKLQSQLYEIGAEVNKSIVTITGISGETDWMSHAYETQGQASGVIIKKDNNYLYVLTEKSALTDAAGIRVGFVDGSVAPATLLKYDGNTGVAILAIELRQLSPDTRGSICVAKVGNSYAVRNGDIVIALGSPLGTNYSILTGNITSVKNKITTLDKNYSIFTSDIAASKIGSGILINTKGEIVGMMMHSLHDSEDVNTLTAVSISELGVVIDRLTKAQDVPYVGLYVSTINSEISEKYQLPKGVFIKEVMVDSPAMYAGLQSGDVITHINGESVYADATYSSKIGALLPGTTCEITVRRQSGEEYIEVKCEVTLGVLQ